MTPRQTELAKRICTPIQRKVMMMRERYVVEEVAKSLDKTIAEIDQIEAAGWLKLGSYAVFKSKVINILNGLQRHPAHTMRQNGSCLHLRASRIASKISTWKARNISPLKEPGRFGYWLKNNVEILTTH